MKNATCSVSIFIPFAITFILTGCVGPHPGPDKQGEGLFTGAAYGAGAGAVTGAQIAGVTGGVGAAVGAGFGAVFGAIRGYAQDQFEEELLLLSEETRREREIAFAQELIADHYQRRSELHPTRDIFPADVFFRGDSTELRPTAMPIMREIYRLNKDRYGWSRLTIAAYVRSVDKESDYAKHLAEKRAENFGNALTRMGIEPRRMQVRGVVTAAPVLIDPLDNPQRYSAAMELIMTDLS